MNVQLEPVEFRHLNWLKALRNDPEVMQFCRQPHLLTSQNQEDWFKTISKTREMIPFIVSDEDLQQSEKWVGYCALSHIDPIADKAECSYVIDPKHAKKGYGQAAVFQLLYFGFYNLGLQKIYSDTFEFNEEIDFNKSCGFTVNGYLPRHYFKGGKLIGAIPMSILREDFDKTYKDEISKIKSYYGKPL